MLCCARASAVAPIVTVSADEHEAIPLFSALDERLTAAIANGAIKLVSATWLRSGNVGARLLRRQALESQERETRARIFLTDQEAVLAISANQRCVGALTYGWTSPGEPDPTGECAAMRLDSARLSLLLLLPLAGVGVAAARSPAGLRLPPLQIS